MKKIMLLLVIYALLIPQTSFAEKTIFVTDDYPPYNFIKDGKVIGISSDIVRMVCKQLGIKSEIRVLSWQRAVNSVKEGSADAIFYLYKTKKREEFLYYPSEPINNPKNVIWVQKDNNIKINSIDDLKNKVVGVIDSYSYSSEFDNYKGIVKQPYKDVPELVTLLNLGRIEFAASAEMPFRYISKQNNFKDKFKVAFVITDSPVYVGFSKAKGKKNAVLAENFGKTLRKLKDEGIIQKIINQYVK
ncbi:Extracellular solute-binding protein, family 3 [Desulfonema limicola]|uniref:Extracellular solute-binding protein, family 3 n=1 Tax=Desulfonema limicola TaxID=45656 RepID=A0A975B9A8_9BACT|nr:transporter substrate-binding domain-containing protein [Desulfonema limicola]QTA81286.1 Extracellular solute-binding protein, family 3 [Desulfonema limicola]